MLDGLVSGQKVLLSTLRYLLMLQWFVIDVLGIYSEWGEIICMVLSSVLKTSVLTSLYLINNIIFIFYELSNKKLTLSSYCNFMLYKLKLEKSNRGLISIFLAVRIPKLIHISYYIYSFNYKTFRFESECNDVYQIVISCPPIKYISRKREIHTRFYFYSFALCLIVWFSVNYFHYIIISYLWVKLILLQTLRF
uniref:Putative product n=1 Tax=Xenopsylla cheopis TaxID=163159 RepID=A0A6M2E2X4_XENCH